MLPGFLMCEYVSLVLSLTINEVSGTVYDLYTAQNYNKSENTSTSLYTGIRTKDSELKNIDSSDRRRALVNDTVVQYARHDTIAVSNSGLAQIHSAKHKSVLPKVNVAFSTTTMNTSSHVSKQVQTATVDVLSGGGEDRVYLMDSATCEGVHPVLEHPGTVLLTSAKETGAHYTHCTWDVLAPVGQFIVVTVNRSTLSCDSSIVAVYDDMPVYDKPSVTTVRCVTLLCEYNAPSLLYSSSNYLTIDYLFRIHTEGKAELRFFFISEVPDLKKMTVKFTSSHTGFIASPAYGSQGFPPCCVDAYTIHVPRHHVVMISFVDFQLTQHSCTSNISLSVFRLSNENGTAWLVWKECSKYPHSLGGLPPTAVYNTSLLFQLISDISTIDNPPGFKLLFSFHNESSSPQQQPSGLFNCSSVIYQAFRQHLDCNFAVECIAGEDEVDCPDFAAECDGSLKYGNKCYRYFIWQDKRPLSWNEAREFCQQQGQHLVMFKTKADWHNIQKILRKRKSVRDVFVGLQTASFTTPIYYRYIWQWSDSTINYSHLPMQTVNIIKLRLCYVLISGFFYIDDRNCDEGLENDVICETTLSANLQSGISFSPHTVQWSKSAKALLQMFYCPRGHVTHYFLSCGSDANCSSSKRQSECANNWEKFGNFLCANGQRIPFTLVCDFYNDCTDSSDESFCKHSRCETYCPRQRKCSLENMCGNGQCVSVEYWCNGRQDCRDGSDETCEIHGHEQINVTGDTSHTVVSFNGYGDFTSVPITSSTVCPETHFQCPESYCLPVYLRCNQVYDCPNWEDEADCHSATCPGFYRCRDSAVCLHADHVCDGVFQCPRQDDELLCGLTCPEDCQCQGLSFVCAMPFPVASHRQVRYVDASGSGMTPDDFRHNHYIIYLRLSRCGLDTVGNLSLDNLRLLDLHDNLITSFVMDVALKFQNLQHLILSNNPLVTLYEHHQTPKSHKTLNIIDLSQTLLTEIPKDAFEAFVNLKVLNVSFSRLMMLPDCFRQNINLEVLDIREVDVKIFPGEIFHGLTYLKTVFSDNYRLCCQSVLPFNFDHRHCFAPRDEISSCEDLLRTDVYRLFLWVFAILSAAGNAGSLLFRLILTAPSSAGHNVFVTNLSASDMLMGIYLTVIGVADHTYRGRYLWHDMAWKLSIVCKLAGFVSFLSNEVSAIMVFLITLDRFVALHFPFSILRFKRQSALTACASVWVVGISLAAVPLLPVTSDWEYYSQTGICIPLPVTRSHKFKGRAYSFGIMIVFNLVLFLLIAGGQAFVYWSVRVNSLQDRTSNKRMQDATIARRLITVALTDFLCWFPIGLLGILSSLGIPIPGEVNVGMAIFVLPVNSTLNPFLYTFNIMMEKRRKVKKMRKMRRIEEEFINRLHSSVLDAENNDQAG